MATLTDSGGSQITESSSVFKPSASSAFSPPPRPVSISNETSLKMDGEDISKKDDEDEEDNGDEKDEKDLDDNGSDGSLPLPMDPLERLIRTHPIWFLPDISRAGVVHLLQGKDVGVFIVRKSSKPGTMALSVRLPEGRGPHIEHYLIENKGTNQLHLEGSQHKFQAVPFLVAHYSSCCDELPVQLTLPRTLQEASLPQLTSLSLLGQEFWLSALVVENCNSLNQKGLKNVTIQLDDPLVDTKKSSTVPVAIVSGQVQVPKPLPRSNVPGSSSSLKIPPPIPPRTGKAAVKSDSVSSSNIVVTTTVAVNMNGNTTRHSNSEVIIREVPEITNSCDSQSNRTSHGTSVTSSSSIIPSHKQQLKRHHPYYNQLEDKFSDYEDIWSGIKKLMKTQDNNNKNCSKKSRSCHPGRRGHPKFCSNSTQTEPEAQEPNSIHSLKRQIISPFYNKPFDVIKGHSRTDSDPSIYSCSLVGRRSNSLESLLDRLKSFDPVGSLDFCQLITNNHCSESGDVCLQVGDGRMKLYKNRCPSPSSSSFISSVSQSRMDTERIPNQMTSTRDDGSSWPVDSSWEWQSDDDGDNIDEDYAERRYKYLNQMESQSNPIEELLVAQENKRLKIMNLAKHRPSPEIDLNRYQRLSQRYILESGVEESDEDDGVRNDKKKKEATGGTIEDLIVIRAPELKVTKMEDGSIKKETMEDGVLLRDKNSKNLQVEDYYDEEDERNKKNSGGTITDTETVFSEPWDSEFWDGLIKRVFPDRQSDSFVPLSPENEEEEGPLTQTTTSGTSHSSPINISNLVKKLTPKRLSNYSSLIEEGSINEESNIKEADRADEIESTRTSTCDFTEVTSFATTHSSGVDDQTSNNTTTTINSNINEFCEINVPAIGKTITGYIDQLMLEGDNTFAKSVINFIQCTKCQREPRVIMRNIRQFMNGMKNYLVKHGEKEFKLMVEEERSKLKSDQFLNIDAILEGSLHKLIIKPLKDHIYQMFVEEYTRNGSLSVMSKAMKIAKDKTPSEIGVRPELKPPQGEALLKVQMHLKKLQRSYSPLKKLEHLLSAISDIYANVGRKEGHLSFGADDFLPIFIYVLISSGMISAEIEADYMWGLLQPALLSGEGGYYLTTLSSCVHVIKSSEWNERSVSTKESPSCNLIGLATSSSSTVTTNTTSSTTGNGIITSERLPSISDLEGYMRIVIPDELLSSIVYKTLPIRPSMTCKEVCRMMAHKYKITNPEDFGLFTLDEKGDEMELPEDECPQRLRLEALCNGRNVHFAYKRSGAKFIWPTDLRPSCSK